MSDSQPDWADEKAKEMLPCEYGHCDGLRQSMQCVSCQRRPAVAAALREKNEWVNDQLETLRDEHFVVLNQAVNRAREEQAQQIAALRARVEGERAAYHAAVSNEAKLLDELQALIESRADNERLKSRLACDVCAQAKTQARVEALRECLAIVRDQPCLVDAGCAIAAKIAEETKG